MIGYLVRRILWLLVVMVIVTGLTFLIFFVMPPTDPAVLAAGRNPSPQTIASLRHLFGTDRPLWVQYGLFVKRLVTGDAYGWPGLGFSYETYVPIRGELLRRAAVTLQLGAGAAVLWLLIGIPIGIISSVRQGSRTDRTLMLLGLFGVSLPVFWLGLLLLYFVWFKLHLGPGSGYVAFSDGIGSWASHMVLPWITLALGYAAWYARMLRGSMLETLRQDFVRTARAKGLRERTVVRRHVLRAAITTLVTMFGMDLAVLLGGSVIVETVFNLPGIGLYAYTAIRSSDIPAIEATTLFAAFFIVVANLLVDLAYAYLDPRVRLSP